MNNIPWWGYVILAGLAWGTYVPIIFFGGSELGGNRRMRGSMAILCVGVAYFVLAVVFPLVLFLSGQQRMAEPEDDRAGVRVAGGCRGRGRGHLRDVRLQYRDGGRDEAKKLNRRSTPRRIECYIGAADLRPRPGHQHSGQFRLAPERRITRWHFDLELPGWKLAVGILLVGVGSFLVLYSKEEAEETKKAAEGPNPPLSPRSAAAPVDKPNPPPNGS